MSRHETGGAPLVRRLPADLLTPLGALMRLRGDGDPDAFLFESVERGERVGRYSYVGATPAFRGELDAAGFRERARAALGQAAHRPGLPRFLGGLVFALSWDYSRALEPRLGAPRGPVALAAEFEDIVAFDHLRQEVFLVHGPRAGEPPSVGERALDRLAARLDAPLPGILARLRGAEPAVDLADRPAPRSNHDCAAFAALASRAKEYIAAGDVFQVVLSRRFELETKASALSIYRALRMINPSPYMFYMKLGSREYAGASPEMLVRVEEDGTHADPEFAPSTRRIVMTHPIAGTRRRGATDAEDLALEGELRADPKERAEHAMLVDLARNDLGRICAGGSVALARHMEIERFSHVMHLVSEVRGRLRPEVDAIDALDATFPAGTVSGAPKVRAMEIIEELEGSPRGFYAGAIGAASSTGTLDACIAIRMVEVEGGMARFQSGAGIVAGSTPEREAEETREKARALMRAIGHAEAEL